MLRCYLFINCIYLGVPPALRAAPGRGRAIQGSASLRCCAQLPLVAPFLSLTYFPRDSA